MKSLRGALKSRNKIFAVLAAGLVVGIGGTMTLASWTDTEWAYGGNGTGGPGVGTSTFVVDQDASNPFVAPGTFTNHDTAPGNVMQFGTGALALTPGDTVYAPVALKSSSASVAGTAVLTAAVAASGVTVNDPTNALRNALHIAIGVQSTLPATAPATCDAAGFATYTPLLADTAGLFSAPATTAEALTAAGGNVLHYCFAISLPAGSPTTLQGLTIAPSWKFTATSN